MKKIATFVLILGLAFQAMAQGNKNSHTIKGKVVEASSNRPVSYTNIGIEGTLLGTASDADGNFELKIPEDMAGKTIYFSAVGYKNKQFPVNGLLTKEFSVIKLKSQSYGVGEVNVEAQNMVLIRILRMASENIKYNYGAGPFNMHFNYSNTKTAGGQPPITTKASILLYDATGYSAPSKTDAYKSRNYSVEKEASDNDYSFSSSPLNIDDLLNFDLTRSASGILNPGLLNDFKLSMESQPVIEGEEYWVIAFSQQNPTKEASGDYYATSFSGKITINKESYSVLRVEGKILAKKNNRQGRDLFIGKSNNDYYSSINYSFVVDYKDVLLKRVVLDKNYSYKGQHVSEQSSIEMERAHSNNLKKLDSRDYFAGK